MSSALQFALTTIQQNDYVSLAVITAVGYDYVLTFSKEIEYIWNKPWTWVSTLFLFVRYCGLYSLILPSLVGSSLFPGTAKTYVCLILVGEIINIIYGWTFLLFLGSADLVMILRVWAMYHQSRLVLALLLILFFFEIISTLLGVVIYSNPKNLSTTTVQILNFSFCVSQPNTIVWTKVGAIFQIANNAAICLFAVVQFVKQSFRMQGATKQWQPNRFMALFVREGILYFFAVLLFDIIYVMGTEGEIPSGGWRMVLASILANVPMYTLTPRFIMSMRELYARDVQADHVSGIDTGFGLSSLYGRGASGTMMVFADAQQNEEIDDVEGIPMEIGAVRRG